MRPSALSLALAALVASASAQESRVGAPVEVPLAPTEAGVGGTVLVETLTRADGLPSNYVLGVYQDRWGFVWLGTDAGAVRWDGRRATTFTADDGLPHPYVTDFAETADGTLWAGTNGGLARRTAVGWEWVDSPAGTDLVYFVRTDPEGRLLLGTHTRGIARREGDRWRTWMPEGEWAPPLRYGEPVDLGDGRLLVGGFREPWRGLLLTPSGEGFRPSWLPLRPAPPSAPPPVPYGESEGLVFTRCGRDLLAVQMGRHADSIPWTARLHLGGESEALTVSDLRAWDGPRFAGLDGVRCRDGRMWGFGRSGLFLRTAGSTHIAVQRQVTSAVVDREGGVWIGQFGQGAARVRVSPLVALTDGPALRLAETPDGTVWASGSGVTEIDPGALSAVQLLPWLRSRALAVRPDGRIRVGEGLRVLRLGAQGMSWAGEIRSPGQLAAYRTSIEEPDWISGLVETADTLYVGSYGNGVRRFAPEGDDFREVDTLGVAAGLPVATVEDVVRVHGAVWALTRLGAARLEGDRFEPLGVAEGLPSSSVFSVYGATDGAVWLGTDRGIAHLGGAAEAGDAGAERAVALHHPRLDGTRVVGFFERPEEPGVVWAVTSQRLFRVEADRVTLVETPPLALDPAHTVEAARYHAATGRLVLATTRGVVVADLDALAVNAGAVPDVAIVAVTIDETPTPMVGTPRAARLADLAPGQRRVVVRAAALRFGGTARVEYRTDGGAWQEAADDGTVVLPAVGAGAHRLEVRAVVPGGRASEEVATLAFRVRPAWWERRTVQALGALAALALLVLVVRAVSTRRLRRRLRAAEVEARLQAERERISQDLHDHVGAQLSTIVSGIDLARIARDAGGDGAPAETGADVLDRLERHARRTMAQLRETIWALHREAVTVEAFYDRVCAHAHERLALHPDAPSVACALDATEADRARPLSPTQTLHLYRIAQEAVANTLRHAGATRLGVTVGVAGGVLTLEVADDGTFRDESGDELRGHGLAGMRRRADDLGADLALDTEDGTSIRVVLPLAARELTGVGD